MGEMKGVGVHIGELYPPPREEYLDLSLVVTGLGEQHPHLRRWPSPMPP